MLHLHPHLAEDLPLRVISFEAQLFLKSKDILIPAMQKTDASRISSTTGHHGNIDAKRDLVAKEKMMSIANEREVVGRPRIREELYTLWATWATYNRVANRPHKGP